MNTLPKLARQLTAVMLLMVSAAAIPQQAGNRYTVEIIVFRTASQSGALAGGAPAQMGDDGVEATSVAPRKLVTAASKLKAAGGYRVLAHAAWTQAPSGWNSRRGVSAAAAGLARAGITGKVILERGQYLHLGIDLTIDDGGRRYQISEVRRVKADEAQYFDHPAVGVIALITAGG